MHVHCVGTIPRGYQHHLARGAWRASAVSENKIAKIPFWRRVETRNPPTPPEGQYRLGARENRSDGPVYTCSCTSFNTPCPPYDWGRAKIGMCKMFRERSERLKFCHKNLSDFELPGILEEKSRLGGTKHQNTPSKAARFELVAKNRSACCASAEGASEKI